MKKLLMKSLFLGSIVLTLGAAAPVQQKLTMEQVRGELAQTTGQLVAPWLPGHEGGSR